MKKYIELIASLLLILVSLGCTKDFEQINENPNSPEEIAPQFLLTNVITVAANQHTYHQGFRLGNYLAQFSASVEFERIDRYEMGSNSDYWNTLYSLQTDIKSMKEVAGSNEAYRAVGDIMSSYLYSQLTDLWGDIPYTQAILAREGNFTPSYDSQEDVYLHPETGILAVLQNAAETLAETNTSIEGDVMFQNDLEKWVRFANSLRVRYLLRISKRVDVSQRLQDLLSEKLMLANADNAVVPYLNSAPNQWPMSNASLGLYQEHRMTTTVDSILSLLNDPRVEVLYKPSAAGLQADTVVYVGMPNGLDKTTIEARAIPLDSISLFGSIFRDVPNGVDAQYMQAAELQFALAEAAQRGLISGSAKDYYEKGIGQSFAYWGVEMPADYLDQPAVAFDGNDDLRKILSQKWLALINCGHEAWFLVRRTGIPDLQPGADNFNGGRYPKRYLYPESEQATNGANYREALQRMGPDDINTAVWWDID